MERGCDGEEGGIAAVEALSTSVATPCDTKVTYSDEIVATSETVATLISQVDNWPAADVNSVVDSVSTSASELHKSVVPLEQMSCAVRPVVKLLKSTLHVKGRSLHDMVNVGLSDATCTHSLRTIF